MVSCVREPATVKQFSIGCAFEHGFDIPSSDGGISAFLLALLWLFWFQETTIDMIKTIQLVSMISVMDVERSIEFYRHLGFEVGDTFQPEGATKPSWAWLHSGEAQLMVSAATGPVADNHSVLLYAHTEDVEAARASLVEAGLNPGAITKPFYAPRGEFKTVDPDGYVVMVTHT